jgi:hypothetical protein
MDQLAFRTNQEVITPFGKGVVQGPYKQGSQYVVRIALSGSATDARCLTRKAVKSSLWAFPVAELKTV